MTIYLWDKPPENREKMATADHIEDRSRGGEPFNHRNLQVLCYKCNGEKNRGKMPITIS